MKKATMEIMTYFWIIAACYALLSHKTDSLIFACAMLIFSMLDKLLLNIDKEYGK